PLSIVEDDGFRNLLMFMINNNNNNDNNNNNNNYTYQSIPTRKTVKARIIEIYNQTITNIKQQFQQEAQFVSITVDIWSNLSNDSFMSITFHYITPEFKMKRLVAEVIHLEGSYTGEAIANHIKRVMNDWICNNIQFVSITTDNAANMIKAAS